MQFIFSELHKGPDEAISLYRENIRLLKIWGTRTDPGINRPNGIHIQYPVWIWIRDTGLNRLVLSVSFLPNM